MFYSSESSFNEENQEREPGEITRFTGLLKYCEWNCFFFLIVFLSPLKGAFTAASGNINMQRMNVVRNVALIF